MVVFFAKQGTLETRLSHTRTHSGFCCTFRVTFEAWSVVFSRWPVISVRVDTIQRNISPTILSHSVELFFDDLIESFVRRGLYLD